MSDTSPTENRPRTGALLLLTFLGALVGFWALYSTTPLISDNDSYYHLAVARGQAEEGVQYQPPIRFGLLGRSFGDKELLFHLALAPFASLSNPLFGGRVALTLIDAAIVAAIGLLSFHAIGRWGFLIPFWLVFSSGQFTWRLVRLRPELLALLIFLAAVWAIARKRYWMLAATGLLFALSYVALHAFAGLCLILFVVLGWVERRWEWKIAFAPLLGLGVGVLVHPHFPNNLKTWWFHAYDYFFLKEVLDIGNEIGPITTSIALLVNCGWLLGLWMLWHATQIATGPVQSSGLGLDSDAEQARRTAVSFGTTAIIFSGLTLLMSRFAIYAIPCVTLWLLFELRRRGFGIGPRVSLPFRGSIPTWSAVLLTCLVSLPGANVEFSRWKFRTFPGQKQAVLAERARAATALPPKAHVLASWKSTPIFMLWAPQARYVNVLDPGLLATVDPAVHRAQLEIFSGREPDVPLTARGATDSEYLAYYLSPGNRSLTARLEADPRAHYLHREISAIVQFQSNAQDAFVLDWAVLPTETAEPPRQYPRLTGLLGSLEGYVDGRRVESSEDCLDFEHAFETASPKTIGYEFAPYGPSSLWLDGQLIAQVHSDLRAVLGQGLFVSPTVSPGPHRVKVSTCLDRTTKKHVGFYLARRQVSESPNT
jgi:hypothetical protein